MTYALQENHRADTIVDIGGILLAAGQGTRFEGGNKLLAEVDDFPIVYHATKTLVDSCLEAVVVVVGHQADAVQNVLSPLQVDIRYNEKYEDGQSTSLRIGVEIARAAGWDAALFALGDMPFVKPKTVDRLVSAYLNQRGTIIAPAYRESRGNPVLFDSCHYDNLASVNGDKGGRGLIKDNDDSVLVPVNDQGIRVDIDSESDLQGATK